MRCGEGGLKRVRDRTGRMPAAPCAGLGGVWIEGFRRRKLQASKQNLQSGTNELPLQLEQLSRKRRSSASASCKCRLVQDYYSDNEELLAKLAAGTPGCGVLVPTGDAVQR
jgi:hypothetical protein